MYAYRPEAMQANMNVMGNMSHAFEPMNNMMGQAYGPQMQMDWSKMIQNPFSADAQLRMMEQAHPKQKAPQYSPMQQIGPDGRPNQGRDWSPPNQRTTPGGQ
jgi:hypothetical protein